MTNKSRSSFHQQIRTHLRLLRLPALIAVFLFCHPILAPAETIEETIIWVVKAGDFPPGYQQRGNVDTGYSGSRGLIRFYRPNNPLCSIEISLQKYTSAKEARKLFDLSEQDHQNDRHHLISRNAGIGEASFHWGYQTILNRRSGQNVLVSQYLVVLKQNWILEVRFNHYKTRNYQAHSDDEAADTIKSTARRIISRMGGGETRDDNTLDCGKDGALTRYLAALKARYQSISKLDRQLSTMIRQSRPDNHTLVELGRNAIQELSAYQQTLREFIHGETRRGLFEELDLLADTTLAANQVAVKYQHLAGVPLIPLNRDALNQSKKTAAETILQLAREEFASRFKSEGLQDILTRESWNEALETAAYHTQRKVNEFLDRETEKVFGLGFHDARSAQRALRMQMRREVRRQVAKLLVKITSNEIVIELLAGPVIRWIEGNLIPRLREALRQKGNIPARVTRSLQTMETARMNLNRLSCNARIAEVRRCLNAAVATIHATRFLKKDIQRANAVQELNRLTDGMAHLKRTMSLARRRFLLMDTDYEEDLPVIDALVGQMLDYLKKAVFKEEPALNDNSDRRKFRQELAPNVPELNVAVAWMKFFEGGYEGVPFEQRHYASRFPSTNSRYIYWELGFDFPPRQQRQDFKIEGQYYNVQGQMIGRADLDAHIQPGWDGSHHAHALGDKVPGFWKPGTYRVELFINGSRVASGSFEVY